MIIGLTTFGVFPLMFWLCVVSEPLVRIVLTEKWMGCVPLMQILCMAYMFDPIMRMNYDILNVKHRSDYSLKAEVLKKTVAFLLLLGTIPFGVKVMCYGLAAYSIADMLIITRFTRKVLPELTFWNEMKCFLPALSISVASSVVAYSLRLFSNNDYILLFGCSVVFLMAYVGISKLFRRYELAYSLDLIKSLINRR